MVNDRTIFLGLAGAVAGTLLASDNKMYKKKVTSDPVKGALAASAAVVAGEYAYNKWQGSKDQA